MHTSLSYNITHFLAIVHTKSKEKHEKTMNKDNHLQNAEFTDRIR